MVDLPPKTRPHLHQNPIRRHHPRVAVPYCARPYTGISRNADSRVEHRAAWVREASGRRRRSAGSPGSVRRCDEDGGPQGSGGRGAARVMRAARLTPPRVRAGLPCATRSRGRPGKPGRVRNLESSGERDEDSSVRWASKWRFFFSERAEGYSTLISAGIGSRSPVGAHSFLCVVMRPGLRDAGRTTAAPDRLLRSGAADGFRSGRWFCVRPCAAERFSAQRRVSWRRPRPSPARSPRPR